MRRAAAPACLAAWLMACGSKPPAPPMKPNEPQLSPVWTEDVHVFRAVVENARDRDWRLEIANPKLGWVVAIARAVASNGRATRERWVFSIRGGSMSAQRFVDVADGGSWTEARVVPEAYDYAREHQELDRIAERLRDAPRRR